MAGWETPRQDDVSQGSPSMPPRAGRAGPDGRPTIAATPAPRPGARGRRAASKEEGRSRGGAASGRGARDVNRATAARSAGSKRGDQPREPLRALDNWLLDIDHSGSLCRYRSPLGDFFDSPDQVFLAYTTPVGSGRAPRFDQSFFEEADVQDKEHQHLFEQWFILKLQEHASTESAKDSDGGVTRRTETAACATATSEAAEVAAVPAERAGGGGSGRGSGNPRGSEATFTLLSRSAAQEERMQPDAVPAPPMPEDAAEVERAEPPPQPAPAPASALPAAATEAEATTWAEAEDDVQANARAVASAPPRARSAGAALRGIAGDEDAEARSATAGSATASRARSEEPGPAKAAKAPAPARPPEGREDPRQAEQLVAKLRPVREAAALLPDPDPRQHAAVALLGHAGAGKSALLGALLRVSGAWDARTFEKFVKEKRDPARGSTPAAETRVERCVLESRRLTLIDPPGQRRCAAQAWAAVAQADIAVLVVAAHPTEFEAGIAKGGQTREHAVLAKSAGLESIVVVVNKMDAGESKGRWSNLRYEEVRAEVWAALRSVGFHDDQVTFVPVSATTGDNLGGEDDEECEACSGWYSGGQLLQVLESAALPPRQPRGPLRVSVSGREKRGNATITVGRVEQGELEAGVAVRLVPSGLDCGVQAVEVGGKEVRSARAGDIVHLRLLGGQPGVGQVLSSLQEPLRAAAKFKAQLRLVDTAEDSPIITPGFRCMLHLHQAVEECEVSKLVEAVDPRTKKKEAAPKLARAPTVVLCVLVVCSGRDVAVEAGAGRFARFSLRTDGGTIAIGKVADLPKAK